MSEIKIETEKFFKEYFGIHYRMNGNGKKICEFAEAYVEHMKQVKNNDLLHSVSVPLNIQEELFNAGFDEGYTNPMEIDGRSITVKEYEEGRKHNFNQWINER